MDKVLRKELKTDEVAEVRAHTVEYVVGHKKDLTRYGLIAAGVLLVAVIGWWLWQSRVEQRRLALSEVLSIKEATIGAEAAGGAVKFFATEAERDKAFIKGIDNLIAQHGGSDEAAVAEYYRGVTKGDAGDLAGARKSFEDAAASGTEYAPLAKYALAGLHAAEGRTAEAEKLYRDIIARPNPLVSSDQATIDLARMLKSTRPEETRKLVEPLRGARGALARTAITLLSETEKKK